MTLILTSGNCVRRTSRYASGMLMTNTTINEFCCTQDLAWLTEIYSKTLDDVFYNLVSSNCFGIILIKDNWFSYWHYCSHKSNSKLKTKRNVDLHFQKPRVEMQGNVSYISRTNCRSIFIPTDLSFLGYGGFDKSGTCIFLLRCFSFFFYKRISVTSLMCVNLPLFYFSIYLFLPLSPH